jgi:hypothetical protein
MANRNAAALGRKRWLGSSSAARKAHGASMAAARWGGSATLSEELRKTALIVEAMLREGSISAESYHDGLSIEEARRVSAFLRRYADQRDTARGRPMH